MNINSLRAVVVATALAAAAAFAAPPADSYATADGPLTVRPIYHASLVLTWRGRQIYVDPTQSAARYRGLGAPDVILITHAHPDHLSPETLAALDTHHATVVMPASVETRIRHRYGDAWVVMANGDRRSVDGVGIEAVPMYNFPGRKPVYHPKGWGNGYVLTLGGKRVYISGDTEDTPELRALRHIDIAFLCMNLPYTMDVAHAAAAVLAFKPKVVYPYHYRGQDIAHFKALVNAKDPAIDVRLRDWYTPG